MIEYKLYTLPNCDKCSDVKKIFGEKNIQYAERNLATRDAKLEMGKIIQTYSGLKRDEQKRLLLPLLLKESDSGVEIANVVDDIKKMLSGEQ